jgi:hypothetical protein
MMGLWMRMRVVFLGLECSRKNTRCFWECPDVHCSGSPVVRCLSVQVERPLFFGRSMRCIQIPFKASARRLSDSCQGIISQTYDGQ